MPKKKETKKNPVPHFVIITGLSGSGMSSATNAFEDLGYFCVDNLPITMLSTFARLLLPNEEEIIAIEKAALVINIRERHFLSEFSNELKNLSKKELEPFVIFFEASDRVLQRRFSETRRPHPADRGGNILEAIREEKEAMQNVRQTADLIIDTSDHTVHTLRRFLVERFGISENGVPLNVQIVSFGHKYGVPREVDLLFDVRHLPNPYFDKKLKHLPGTNRQGHRIFGKGRGSRRNYPAIFRSVEISFAAVQKRRKIISDHRNRLHGRSSSFRDGRQQTF